MEYWANSRRKHFLSLRLAISALVVITVAGCETEPPEGVGKATDGPSQFEGEEGQPEMFSSPLQRAIARGMKPEGDLTDELSKLDDSPIRSRKDGKAICDALRNLPLQPSSGNVFSSPLYALTGLFQKVEGRDAPAFKVLRDEGLPQLIRIFDAKIKNLDDKDADDLLFVLKILAMYGSREGAERIVEAARRPLKPDAFTWHVILSGFSEGHPHRDYVFKALSDPLPPDFLGVALLDSANEAALKGGLPRHPYDSEAGCKRLQSWLEDRDPEHFSYAHSATAALPFLTNPSRDQLLALAMDHTDASVQMEAAWAAGKLGSEVGLKVLARSCLDVNNSDVAQRYLAELKREDLIPAESKDPSFHAKATFGSWLAHPNELGRPPDELEIVDHRLLAWPTDRKPKPFWLIRYRVRDSTGLAEDDVDCGLVGSMTWCFFAYKMHERPPEDAYAIFCYWEMEHAKLIEEAKEFDALEYAGMLGQWQGDPLQDAKIIKLAELSPKLKYPAQLVALASATLNGAAGWLVLDGPRSTWYPKAEQPADTFEGILLKIHVGRQLLGFHDQPDRKKYVGSDRPRREPQQIIAAYEKFMTEAAEGAPNQQQKLLGSWGLLSNHFNAYVEALMAVNGATKPETVIEVYGRFLQLAGRVEASIRDKVYGTLGVLGGHFDDYIDALVSCGRSAEIARLIDLFAPYWDNNLGYGRLGSAAFKAGQKDIAERYFSKVREGLKTYYRSEEMSLLAEIWNDRGEAEHARDLLVDCMRRLITEIQESKYNSDRKMFVKELQHHRSTYLRLFPDGENELAKLGIPAEPR